MALLNNIICSYPGINSLLLNVNFYAEDENVGGSIFPFLSFIVFLAGVMIVFIAAINLLTTWREFNQFYDEDALKKNPDKEKKRKKMITHGIIIAVGVVVIIISHFMNYMV